jgi:hypothetical protein
MKKKRKLTPAELNTLKDKWFRDRYNPTWFQGGHTPGNVMDGKVETRVGLVANVRFPYNPNAQSSPTRNVLREDQT